MAPTYCTAADVAKFMGIEGGFTESTVPSLADVNQLIEDYEDEIDQRTFHSWKGTTVTDEYYNFHGFTHQEERFLDWSDRSRIYMKHRKIQEMTKLECWNGTAFEDFVQLYDEGRDKDYWIDYDRGVIHFANRYPWRMRHSIRLTYIYGDVGVHGDIKNACKRLVAADILQQDDRTVLLPEGTSNIPIIEKARMWTERADQLIDRHQEIVSW